LEAAWARALAVLLCAFVAAEGGEGFEVLDAPLFADSAEPVTP